jgi:D-alanyl-lipoteichoic acid acyltransferase DltB (MBOAT superfamily)
MLLLGASYFFYMCWKVDYILLITSSTLIAYWAGLRMAAASDPKRKRNYFILSLVFNLGALFFFKYFNFFSRSVTLGLNALNIDFSAPVFNVLLPVGISFYTFQILSYTFDVYSGRTPAERHLGYFALYVSFWPQLGAGPIERSHRMLPQFKGKRDFDYHRVTDGLRLMLWGLFQKVVIADHLAIYVNRVFNHVDTFQGAPLIIASFFFTFQIYCDFSGYSDMAVGAARVFGYELIYNFHRPYFAKSLGEFWQRWHISLSTWFRDYVYIPMGGNRVVKWRHYVNLFITFWVSGLWHGANWTFVVWGALHGLLLVVEVATQPFRQRVIHRWFSNASSFFCRSVLVGVTFIQVSFAWIFFRANTVGEAFTVIKKIWAIDSFAAGFKVVGPYSFLFSILLILILVWVHLKERKDRINHYIGRLSVAARWSVYTLVLWAVIISGVFGVRQEFIYFQF